MLVVAAGRCGQGEGARQDSALRPAFLPVALCRLAAAPPMRYETRPWTTARSQMPPPREGGRADARRRAAAPRGNDPACRPLKAIGLMCVACALFSAPRHLGQVSRHPGAPADRAGRVGALPRPVPHHAVAAQRPAAVSAASAPASSSSSCCARSSWCRPPPATSWRCATCASTRPSPSSSWRR